MLDTRVFTTGPVPISFLLILSKLNIFLLAHLCKYPKSLILQSMYFREIKLSPILGLHLIPVLH